MAKVQRWLEPQGLTLLEGWARDGLTDGQIAHNCGISRMTLLRWRKEYPEIREAVRRGKEVVDYEVERALLKRALGYEYTQVQVEETGESSKRRETTMQVTPDTRAQIFWLRSRRPDKWREKPQEERDGPAYGVVVLAPVEEPGGEEQKEREETT